MRRNQVPRYSTALAFCPDDFSACSEVEREKVFSLLSDQAQLGIGLPGGKAGALSGTATLEVLFLLKTSSGWERDEDTPKFFSDTSWTSQKDNQHNKVTKLELYWHTHKI